MFWTKIVRKKRRAVLVRTSRIAAFESAFRRICQTGGNVAAAETDVLQFSIAKMAENNNICLARWIRDLQEEYLGPGSIGYRMLCH